MSSAELNEEDRTKERYDPLLASNANDHYGGTQTVTRKQNTKYKCNIRDRTAKRNDRGKEREARETQ